jgi:broad specificity phosphatase PhoE
VLALETRYFVSVLRGGIRLVRVILVRHGETSWNKARRMQGGGSDTPLNETGNKQKELIALRLKAEDIQAIYCSPLQRAKETANAIARYHNLEIMVEPALREIDIGEFEGVSVFDIGRQMDEVLTTGYSGETVPTMPGGESLKDVQTRVWSTLLGLVSQYSSGNVVVVSHYFAILSVICSVLNIPMTQIGRFRMNPGTISTVAFDGTVPRLLSFNDSGHLTSI